MLLFDASEYLVSATALETLSVQTRTCARNVQNSIVPEINCNWCDAQGTLASSIATELSSKMSQLASNQEQFSTLFESLCSLMQETEDTAATILTTT